MFPVTAESTTDSRLAEKKTLCGVRDIALFREHSKDNQEIEIGLSQLRKAHR